MRIKARNIARDWRTDPARTMQDLMEGFDLTAEGKPGGLKPEYFSIRDLAEELIFDEHGDTAGYRFLKEYCDPSIPSVNMQEATTAVDSTAFTGVLEQLLVRRVLDSYRNPAFVLSNLIPSVPTPFTEGEIVPGMTLPRNPEGSFTDTDTTTEDALVLGEAEEYKILGFGQEWTMSPPTVKRGCVIAVTREMLFRDRTGLALRRAAYVGTILGLSKERRITDVVIGAENPYKEKRLADSELTSRRTYYGAGDTSPPWVNHIDALPLDDYSAIDTVDAMFADMKDPNTGEPIVQGGRYLLHMPAKRSNVARVLTAQTVMEVTNSGNRQTWSGNPVRPGIIPIESVYAYHRLIAKLGVSAADAKNYYIYGDIPGAFEYLENWPIELSRQAPGADAEFWQDIVTAFKASERGAPAVVEPRRVIRTRAVAASSSG